VKTFPNAYDLEELLTGLGTGEAVVTVLSEKGAPRPGRRDPAARPGVADGPGDGPALDSAVRGSPLYERYAQAVDRESAFEKLAATPAERPPHPKHPKHPKQPKRSQEARAEEGPSVGEQVVGSGMFKSLARSVGTRIGREITCSLFGTARRRR
jgi:uncharacterized protein